MKLDKRIENERLIYTPFTTTKPKLHEMGYFTDNMRSFDNLKDCTLYYVYGELIDYNEDCKGQYYIDDYNDDYYECRYCCGFEDDDFWCDPYCECDYYVNNYAFYIPENSIPQEKREWYRSHACNVR